jgi:hypothetical protein
MRVPTVAITALLSLQLVAVPGRAQYLAPVAVRPLAAAAITRQDVDAVPRRDTLTDARREISEAGTLVGGAAGGVAGALIGLAIASRTHMDCHVDYCGLAEGALGLGLGESIGLALGAHLGSRSTHSAHIVTTALSSVVIAAGGTFAALMLGEGGVIMVPFTPALQLAVALVVESH